MIHTHTPDLWKTGDVVRVFTSNNIYLLVKHKTFTGNKQEWHNYYIVNTSEGAEFEHGRLAGERCVTHIMNERPVFMFNIADTLKNNGLLFPELSNALNSDNS